MAKRIIESLGVPWVSLLSMDSFYKVLSAEQHQQAARNEYNFDHPGNSLTEVASVLLTLSSSTDAFDFELLVQTLGKLKEGKRVEVPVYDFATHSRAKYTVSYSLPSFTESAMFPQTRRGRCMEQMSWSLRELWHLQTENCWI